MWISSRFQKHWNSFLAMSLFPPLPENKTSRPQGRTEGHRRLPQESRVLGAGQGMGLRGARLLPSGPRRWQPCLPAASLRGGPLPLSLGIFFLVLKSVDLLSGLHFHRVPEFRVNKALKGQLVQPPIPTAPAQQPLGLGLGPCPDGEASPRPEAPTLGDSVGDAHGCSGCASAGLSALSIRSYRFPVLQTNTLRRREVDQSVQVHTSVRRGFKSRSV